MPFLKKNGYDRMRRRKENGLNLLFTNFVVMINWRSPSERTNDPQFSA
jgi:hypothetical protein